MRIEERDVALVIANIVRVDRTMDHDILWRDLVGGLFVFLVAGFAAAVVFFVDVDDVDVDVDCCCWSNNNLEKNVLSS